MRAQAVDMEEKANDTVKDTLEVGGDSPAHTEAKKCWQHVLAIRYNRVFIGLIIASMLFVFVNLASLDSVQGQEFAPLHQTWFALVAFVILTFGDLSLEFFIVFLQTSGMTTKSTTFSIRCYTRAGIQPG
jgi:hypothetical protein